MILYFIAFIIYLLGVIVFLMWDAYFGMTIDWRELEGGKWGAALLWFIAAPVNCIVAFDDFLIKIEKDRISRNNKNGRR